MLCKISLRPKTWIQQSTTKIRKLTVLTHEVFSGVQKGWGKHLRMRSKNWLGSVFAEIDAGGGPQTGIQLGVTLVTP